MECYKCGTKDCISKGLSMFPVDPKGTEGRRWACENCIKPSQLDLDDVERDIIDAVNPGLISKIEHMGFAPRRNK